MNLWILIQKKEVSKNHCFKINLKINKLFLLQKNQFFDVSY